jgi:Dolichyl-phosphate-mannose-protein mannosyltransferase
MNKNNVDNYIITILLIVGAILRFYDFESMQLMNDELSALARTHFSGFKELITGGILVDTHPPFVQVFLFYWLKIAGDSEQAIRIPFIIAGILCIYLVFKIGEKWFNATVGLLAAAFISTLQYSVFYSQIARPYISGLLFSLLMVLCWTAIIFEQKKKNTKYYIGYVLASLFCAYNHHFSLLFAFIVGTTGLFLINKSNRKKYIISGFCILLFYIPNLPIFFAQLKMGGIGDWLAAPNSRFLLNYLEYIFHFSYLLYALVVLLIMAGFFIKSEKSNSSFLLNNQDFSVKKQSANLRIICISWFLLPIFIGYVYSVFINPVMQYSMLIFSFPFLLFFIFSFYNNISGIYKITIVATIISLNIYSLINEREHYNIFYSQPHEQFFKDTFTIIESIKNEKEITIHKKAAPKYSDYYFKKYNKNYSYLYFDEGSESPNVPEFIKVLDSLHTNYFIIDQFCLDYLPLIKTKYPYLIKINNGFTYDFYCFSKIKPTKEVKLDVLLKTENNLRADIEGWNIDKTKIIKVQDSSKSIDTDITTKNYLSIDSLSEYAATFEILLNEIASNKYVEIYASANFKNLDTNHSIQFVLSIEKDVENIFWRSSDVNNFKDHNYSEFKGYLTASLKDLNIDFTKKTILKIYLWNKDKHNCLVNDFKIEFIKSNPYVYGLYEKIPN